MWTILPGSFKLGTERQKTEHTARLEFRDMLFKQLQGRGIEPVQVFNDEQHGADLNHLLQPLKQQHFRPFLHFLWWQGESRKTIIRADAKQPAQQRDVFGRFERPLVQVSLHGFQPIGSGVNFKVK